ncbi:hypothetical protein GOTRE_001_01370 [Gordonia terrae NBRC 100016]|uniref:Uncharacterized protein n=1 Tax=Gordonia terrae NBRC 100016 TaxID=1089454 RepID=A0ABQ0H7M7_9ACTN|nr:hypothetical protein GOTRE_001_01370 [Gordonia terrae NBRC 100016]
MVVDEFARGGRLGVEDRADVGEGHPDLAESAECDGPGFLRRAVQPVSRRRVDAGRGEHRRVGVEPQRGGGQPGALRKRADRDELAVLGVGRRHIGDHPASTYLKVKCRLMSEPR